MSRVFLSFFIFLVLLFSEKLEPTILAPIVAALFVYLIPYYLGSVLTKKISFSFDNFITNFVFGSFLILGLFLLIHWPINFANNLDNTYFIIKGILLISTVLVLIADLLARKQFIHNHSSLASTKTIAVLILISTTLFYFIWKGNTPPPGINNWDLLHHTVMVDHLSNGYFSLVLTQISDYFTINSYTPLYHILVTVPKVIFKSDTLTTFWYLEAFHYIFTTLFAYWLGKKVFGKESIGFIAGIVNIFVFESNTAYTSLFFLPQTLAASLGAFLIIKYSLEKNIRWLEIAAMLLMVFLTHYFIGSAVIGILILLFVTKFLINKWPKLTVFIVFLSLGIFLLTLIWGLFGKITLLSREEAQTLISTQEKLPLVFTWWGLTGIVFFVLGIFKFFKRQEQISQSGFIFISFICISLVFIPLSYSLKFVTLAHFPSIIIMTGGIVFVLNYIKSKIWKSILLALIIISFLGIFLNNTLDYKSASFNGNSNSFISQSDLATGLWLKENYNPQTTFLVSDPETQGVMEAISGINTQGGGYPREDTLELVASMNNEMNPMLLTEKILKINDSIPDQNIKGKILINLGGRYFTWQRLSDNQKKSYSYEIWAPQKLAPLDKIHIENLTNSPFFKKVYQDQENTLLEVLPNSYTEPTM